SSLTFPHRPRPPLFPYTTLFRSKVREALQLLTDEEAAKLINEDELKIKALANAEQNGIVFIDEIDKVTRRQETIGADVSREGVRSEEHTSELQSQSNLVCRLLLE